MSTCPTSAVPRPSSIVAPAPRRCADCGRGLVGGWIERPGTTPVCLSCDTARWVRAMRDPSRQVAGAGGSRIRRGAAAAVLLAAALAGCAGPAYDMAPTGADWLYDIERHELNRRLCAERGLVYDWVRCVAPAPGAGGGE